MSRAPDRTPKGWGWQDTVDKPARSPEPSTVHNDADHRVVGTILGPTGEPMHTVHKPGTVPVGYRGKAT